MEIDESGCIRLDAQLQAEVEGVLGPGETVSSFVVESLERAVELRRVQADFIARALASREEYRRTGVSFSVDESMDRLQELLDRRRAVLGAKAS